MNWFKLKRKIIWGPLLILFLIAVPFGYTFCAIGRIFMAVGYLFLGYPAMAKDSIVNIFKN